jgi:hypothetical protein
LSLFDYRADCLGRDINTDRYLILRGHVVACQFGVMFFPDKVQGYREARRIPQP